MGMIDSCHFSPSCKVGFQKWAASYVTGGHDYQNVAAFELGFGTHKRST